MSDCGKKIRLHRVLGGPGHRALVVAFDHPLVLGPIPGTENPVAQVRRFCDAQADAVLLNFGVLKQFADSPLEGPLPALIARIDWTTVWSVFANGGKGELRSTLVARPEEALRHGADAVLTYMVVGTGNADFESKEIARTADVARECERVGMPLIVEALARGKDVISPAAPRWLKHHTRIAYELGADAVKTDYAGDPVAMKEVVSNCPIPILVLGGSRQGSDDEALEVVRGAAAGGAAGIFFGRNVFQSPDMSEFLRRARAALEEKPRTSAREPVSPLTH